jgi:adenylosuccinate synthase
MMKSDVMNDFDTINICTGYEVNGETVQDLTYETLANPVKPLYKSFDGWKQPLHGISDYDLLPAKLKEYTGFIENTVGLPVKILSSGPGREETIQR